MKKTTSLKAEASLLSPPTPPKSGFKESWGNLVGSGRNLAIANTLTNFQQNALIITHSMNAAERLHQDISLFLEDIPNAPTVHLFADWETLPYDSFSPHQDIISERIQLILRRIRAKSKKNYPDKTGLIVYFDDASIDITIADRELLSNVLEDSKSLWSKRFDQVFLVGPTTNNCIEKKA